MKRPILALAFALALSGCGLDRAALKQCVWEAMEAALRDALSSDGGVR